MRKLFLLCFCAVNTLWSGCGGVPNARVALEGIQRYCGLSRIEMYGDPFLGSVILAVHVAVDDLRKRSVVISCVLEQWRRYFNKEPKVIVYRGDVGDTRKDVLRWKELFGRGGKSAE